ncbi:hypothetical protein ACFYT4_28375 [Streptomyces sp. NPDC004609]|uniref:hypothetical protein n=1 Tax=Streptomyces sp. NPDC004609 TaxID=3364704 RepID=UPI003692D7A4
MIGVELVRPGTKEPHPEATGAVLERARERGLLVGRGGLLGNVIRVTPPMTVTGDETEEALAVLGDVLTNVSDSVLNA